MTGVITRGPSPCLSWSELGCKDAKRTPYPVEFRESRAVPLAAEFEAIRASVAAPVRIGSAYRTFEHNRSVGGSKASQHMEGRALDLYPPTGMSVTKLYDVIRAVAGRPESMIQAIGIYPSFIHFDIRPARADGKLTVWHGSRAWAEVK